MYLSVFMLLWLVDAGAQRNGVVATSIQNTMRATGNGRTTGHIANITVTNLSDDFLDVAPQMFYIPSDGNFQGYVARIPEGITIPPNTTTNIPVNGVCTDPTLPPVPTGEPMNPKDWIPVSTGTGFQVPDPLNPVSTVHDIFPGGIAGLPTPPSQGIHVSLIDKPPLPAFDPVSIPGIISSPGFKPTGVPGIGAIPTWPGTEIPVGGIFNPIRDPTSFAPLIVKVVEEIETAITQISDEGLLVTPFSGVPDREYEAVLQQVVWIYTAGVTDQAYEREDFEKKVYEQYTDATGISVSRLPEDDRESISTGIGDFWNTFMATGIAAKVLSPESPALDLSDAGVTFQVSNRRTPACRCNNITFHLEVRRGADVVHSDRHTIGRSSVNVGVRNLNYGDVLDVKISAIRANCACDETECQFFPAQSQNRNSPGYTKTDTTRPGQVDIEMVNDPAGEIGPNGNNNCQNTGRAWNASGTEYNFRLETRDENTMARGIFQRLSIKAYCEADGCRRTLCRKSIQLNFVTAR